MKNNKTGFTLTEILAVIAILGIIMLIAIPSIMMISKSIKKRELETKKEALISAAEDYAKNNLSEFNGATIIQIPVRTLLYYGYVTSDAECEEPIGCVMNPVTNSSMNDEIITVRRNLTITQAVWGAEARNYILAKFVATGEGCTVGNKGLRQYEIGLGCTENCEISAPAINREGFTILGWNSVKGATNGIYNPGDKISLNSSVTFYTITKKDVNVTFDANGGAFSGGAVTAIKKCNYYNAANGCAISQPTVTRAGHLFTAWVDSSSNELDFSRISDNLAATAQWQACPAGQYAEAGATACSECTGNTYTNIPGQSACKVCEDGTSVNSTHTGCDNIHKLTIMYYGNGHTSFSSGSSTGLSVNSSGYVMRNGSVYIQTVNYGDAVSSTSGLDNYNNSSWIYFSKNGYIGESGKEWYVENNNGVKTYFDQTDVTVTAINLATSGGCNLSTQNCTVTAKVNWVPNTFTVAYAANGGSGSTSSHTCTYDAACALSSSGFYKNFYKFVGWKKNNSGSILGAGASIKNAATSGTVTYFAQWEACSCTGNPGSTCGNGWYSDTGALCVGAKPLKPGDDPELRATCCYH